MKSLLKTTANLAARLLVLPLAIGYFAAAAIVGQESCFAGYSQLLSLLPGHCGTYLRRAFYRYVLPRVGEDLCVGFGALLSSPGTRLGHKVYIGPYSVLGNVTIENDVLIASHVSIINGGAQHGSANLDIPMREQPGEYLAITLGRGCWIGERAVVMADVGEHCIVGAGAVVTRALPPYSVAVGVPARVIRSRLSDNTLPCTASKVNSATKDQPTEEVAHAN